MVYFISAVLGLRRCLAFSLVWGRGGYSLVVVCTLLIAVASFVLENQL